MAADRKSNTAAHSEILAQNSCDDCVSEAVEIPCIMPLRGSHCMCVVEGFCCQVTASMGWGELYYVSQ